MACHADRATFKLVSAARASASVLLLPSSPVWFASTTPGCGEAGLANVGVYSDAYIAGMSVLDRHDVRACSCAVATSVKWR